MLIASLRQAWPPFVLVAGLLAIGLVASRDGLFRRGGALLQRLPGPPPVLLVAGCVLVAVVTAILNLDTAVVFVTPVIVVAARHRGAAEEPFVYAAVFVANASSLYLPGSNLTNLLVLGAHPGAVGGSYASALLAPAIVATVVTILGLLLIFRRALAQAGTAAPPAAEEPWAGPGLAGAIAAAVLTVAFRNPALPVLGIAVLVCAWALAIRRTRAADVVRAVSPHVLLGVFAVATGLGVLARAWHGPARLLAHASRPLTAVIAAGATGIVNNLPAAVLLSARSVPHPRALLIGLNLGPNLAVTGSLAAYLWMSAAREVGAETNWRAFSRRGLILAPVAIAAALLVSSH